MSISPFSPNEIKALRDFFEKNKFHIHGLIENNFRYSINRKNKTLIFTLKFPIKLALRMNIPFEIVSFQVSLAFKLWKLDQNIYKVIIYVLKMLISLANQVNLEHKFELNENEKKRFVKIQNLITPELIKNESDRAWVNRIRISLMNKRHQFKEFDNNTVENIVKVLSGIGLEPTFKQPWEISKGIPKIRTSETLFFSNEESEFFILEKGYFTYYRDVEYKKFLIRSFFESYTPYVLIDLFKDNPNFKIEIYVENWIKFARLLLNSVIKIVDSNEINQNEFILFRPKKELDTKDFELEQNNFPFSALHYESNISKELYPLHNDLFNTPPSNFEIIETINYYTKAEELIKKFQFKEATRILEESLKIFNKYGQKKAIVSILLQLGKIASVLNQSNAEINYLQNALGVAKSGNVPKDIIVQIYYELGKANHHLKFYNEAISSFDILINFLESEGRISKKLEYLGISFLYKGLISLEQKKITESKIYLKKAFEIGNKEFKVKLKYYLLRAQFFKNNGNFSQAKKLFKTAFSSVNIADIKYRTIIVDLLLDLSEIYIHYRKDTKKGFHYLKLSEKLLSKNTISALLRVLRWNLLNCDFYQFRLKDKEKFNHFQNQSNILKDELRKIGVIK